MGLLKYFLSLSSPMKSSMDFIIRTDFHPPVSRGVGLLSHNVQFCVWGNRHCSMNVPCVCSCNLECQQEIWAVWGQTNLSLSSQNLMPLHFTLWRWWLQQQPVLDMWGHQFRKNTATRWTTGEGGGLSKGFGFFLVWFVWLFFFFFFLLQPVNIPDTAICVKPA